MPTTAGNDAVYDVAPALTVRLDGGRAVASSLIARPGAATGAVDLGDGLFGAADPDYPPEQMWVPLNERRLEFLRLMADRAPCRPDEIIAELADSDGDRHDLERLADQLRAGGLIALADANEWAQRGRRRRTDAIPWDRERAHEKSAQLDLGARRSLMRTDACALVVTARGFERHHPDGTTRDILTGLDVMVLSVIHAGRDADRAYEALAADGSGMERATFDERLRSLGERGLVVNFESAAVGRISAAIQAREQAYQEAEDTIRQMLDEERVRAAETGVKRPLVIAFDVDANPLLSLGTVVAYSMAYRDGCLTEDYRFAPIHFTDAQRFERLFPDLADWPVVALFSDYLWTVDATLAMTARVKEKLPGALTVHGGPEMPKYADDAERFFAANPAVDCGVRGEGEASLAALLEALVPAIPAWSASNRAPDLSAYADVAGLTLRTGDGLVLTGDRERIADLETIPSPYLTGLFEDVGRRQSGSVILESNRGCPYGCTFCDWGSATLSRIRKFSLQRVKDEMEWAARAGIADFGLADANFGILERDVELAEWAVELKARYGVPTSFQVTYAKSRVQHLTKIVRILAEAGIVTQAAVSVQTMDEQVLKIVRRKNLDLDQHLPLVQEVEDLGLPIYSDMMLGLPGSTVETVRSDLQFFIDREIHYRPNPTQLLVNSPMNDEAYRLEHGIVARPGEYLIESRTYTREDMRVMMDMAEYLLVADRRGTLRELATYTRSETGLPETEFYEQLIGAGYDSKRWPHLGYLNTVVTRTFVPPGSWVSVVEEVGEFMVELGVPDDDALATALTVQLALIPMSGRSFPETLHLPHDYLAWHASIRQARSAFAEGRWAEEVQPLRTYGPGPLEINDDTDSCGRVIGVKPRGSWAEIVWELDTPIARAAQRVKDTV